tara:strand:+ start:10794 stop:10979 length:186 start_codon:yes stop_codon:yes gene_type:complete
MVLTTGRMTMASKKVKTAAEVLARAIEMEEAGSKPGLVDRCLSLAVKREAAELVEADPNVF